MGYTSAFALTVWQLKDTQQLQLAFKEKDAIIAAFRASCFEAIDALDADGCANGYWRWYDAEKDVAEFSKLYPDKLFRLHREGEENNDLSYTYFVNGKTQNCLAEITYPPFDYDQLQ